MTTTPETLETLRELGRYIASALPSAVLSTEVKGGELSVRVHRSAITRMITCLRDDSNCQFTQLIDICGVDYPDKEERFEIVYHLLSMKHRLCHRCRLCSRAPIGLSAKCGICTVCSFLITRTCGVF